MDEDDNLQKITELIYDDMEIVTPTKISRILDIKIQDAQSLLDKYVKNADIPGQTDLSWTYTLIGRESDNSFSISVVKGDELNKRRDNFKDVLSEHVFSVQKHGSIDLVMLGNLEPFIESKVRTKPLQGSVVTKDAIKRQLKKNVAVVNDVKATTNNVENRQNTATNAVNKLKKTGIEGFCTKAATNSNTQLKPAMNGKAKQKNMMANFFSKSNSSNKTEIINETPKEKPPNDEDANINENSSDDMKTEEKPTSSEDANINENDFDDMNMDLDNVVPSQIENVNANEGIHNAKSNKVANREVKKSKKRKSEHKSGQASKKRKRIVETVDLDSDIFASSESEIEVVPDIHYSDDNYEEETKPQSTALVKARRMKQISEHFMDEDGYMNTVQKYVVVSDYEDEENKEQNAVNVDPEKPAVKSTTKKEISPKKSVKPSKGKTSKTVQNQPSIMSFFKKT